MSEPDALQADAVIVVQALHIETASDVRELLLNSLAGQSEVKLDLSAVEQCDVAGLQVLLAAQKTAAASGTSLNFVATAPLVLETASAIGLSIEGLA